MPVSERVMDYLKSKTDMPYEFLKKAADTREEADITEAKNSYSKLGNYIAMATGNSYFIGLNRADIKPKLLEACILEFAIGCMCSKNLSTHIHSTGDLQESDFDIEKLIRDVEDKKSDYYKIMFIIGAAGNAGEYDLIIKLMEHIRNSYMDTA